MRVSNSVPLARLLLAACAVFCGASVAQDATREKFPPYEIVATHPHDATAFTQGLAVLDGALAESRGLNGRSAITLGDVATGTITRRRDLDARFFAEGLGIAGDRLVQLTWQSGLAFVYDRKLRKLGEFRYGGEGWGLAFDGAHWLMSDGSDRLQRRARDDFSLVDEIRVTDQGRAVTRLNELEYVDGRIYANVWHEDVVAVIDAATGKVVQWIDFSALRAGFAKPPGWDESEHVLNGIAWDPKKRHFYITGKCWPVLYEVKLAGP